LRGEEAERRSAYFDREGGGIGERKREKRGERNRKQPRTQRKKKKKKKR